MAKRFIGGLKGWALSWMTGDRLRHGGAGNGAVQRGEAKTEA